MTRKPFSVKTRLQSFRFAFDGLRVLIRDEHNARIHLVITLLVVIAGIAFRIAPWEWVAILLCIGLVFSMELINSSIEKLADVVSPEKNEKIKIVKDLAAAAVLVSAIVAMVVGLIVFLPRIQYLFR